MERCERCGGLMVSYVGVSTTDEAALPLWRCVACGCVTDPLIEANRLRRALGASWTGAVSAASGAACRAATLAASVS